MLEDLEARWRDERTPQAGVRLAEALQRQGDNIRAEGILVAVETRLEGEPRDLASRVAVGAVRMALGQAADAARVLEEVVKADPTHLKANKLLVEVYLELDQRDKARDRLDLYRLLNEGDPEIEALEGLVVGVAVPPAPEPVIIGGRRLNVAGGDPFAGLSAELVAAPVEDPIFDLSPAPRPEAAPAASPESPAATATLGALYQEQGHREEAAQAYRQALAEEPDNQLAREGLAALLDEPAAASDDEAPAPAPVAFAAELDPDVDRERRIGILRDYLDRIRRGREALAR